MCNKELYDSISPQAAKWLLPDGTVTDKFPISIVGGGDGENGGDTSGFAMQADLEKEIAEREEALKAANEQISALWEKVNALESEQNETAPSD